MIVLCDTTEEIYVTLQRQGALCKTTEKLCYTTLQRKTCHTEKEECIL